MTTPFFRILEINSWDAPCFCGVIRANKNHRIGTENQYFLFYSKFVFLGTMISGLRVFNTISFGENELNQDTYPLNNPIVVVLGYLWYYRE